MKRVKLLVPFLEFPMWATPELPDGQADALVEAGRAELFSEDDALSHEPAGDSEPRNRSRGRSADRTPERE